MLGALAACIIFTLDVSATDVIRGQFGLDKRSSSLVRSAEDVQTLADRGGAVTVLQLGSYLFFGSAYRVQQHLKALTAQQKLQMVIFDFSAVTGIDSSAAANFVRIQESLRDAGIRNAVCGLSPAVGRVVDATSSRPIDVACYSDLDEALEQGENMVLAAQRTITTTHQPLLDWLTGALSSVEYARELSHRLTPTASADVRYLCRQGDPTEALLFRVRVFGPHTLVGEIGFFLQTARTASLKAEDGTIVWSLGRTAFHDLASQRPDIVLALFSYIVRIQSERLAFATRQVVAL